MITCDACWNLVNVTNVLIATQLITAERIHPLSRERKNYNILSERGQFDLQT